jgi:hypothetical protein
LELRPTWEKAASGIAQAETKQATAVKPAASKSAPGPQVGTATPLPANLKLDPERMIDPNAHGALLTTLHHATIESEDVGRAFLKVLEGEIEPAIKELSSCLLYSDSSLTELDQCVEKFESAMRNMRSTQSNLQTSIDKIRAIGDKLLNS